jgi:hypothetical protein
MTDTPTPTRYICPRCQRAAEWTDGIEGSGTQPDEFWCQTCGAETPLADCEVAATEPTQAERKAMHASLAATRCQCGHVAHQHAREGCNGLNALVVPMRACQCLSDPLAVVAYANPAPQASASMSTTPPPDYTEALADALGAMPSTYNAFDMTDEATTLIHTSVEVIADALAPTVDRIVADAVTAARVEAANRYLTVAAEAARGAFHDDPEVLSQRLTDVALHIRRLVNEDRAALTSGDQSCQHIYPDRTRCTLTDHSAPGLAATHGIKDQP